MIGQFGSKILGITGSYVYTIPITVMIYGKIGPPFPIIVLLRDTSMERGPAEFPKEFQGVGLDYLLEMLWIN